MGFLNRLFGTKQSKRTQEAVCKIAFSENGRVLRIEAPQGQWELSQNGPYKYYSQQANSLLHAVEILKKIASIPQLTYFTVDTPDGSLGRDMNGYFTEAPLKTKNLVIESKPIKSETVKALSLKSFGDMVANQTAVAHLKNNGEYAQLILLLECGHCGYQSPVETQPGTFVRECYCCGVQNESCRGTINIILGSGKMEI
ncbi:hypothetical protein [Candidatus Leptofilum sp.]|uniref:hypothetical protein n=1 Tax=Candidatus Leptofilum sp. TaxID=3241576 RepID=UPI003B5AE180